ncbi:MAG: orotate phosphoribosyltransferase [Cyanobacteria bacterium J06627_8]
MNDGLGISANFQSLLQTPDQALIREALLNLFCQVAYREGEFLLSSGQTTSYYINGKQVALHAHGAALVGRALLPMLSPETKAVAGLTLGADPLVTATSVVGAYEGRSLTAMIIRKEAKGHGTRAYIEGPELPPETEVTVLEDVVTTGQSAMKAVHRLRDAGYIVKHVLALVDREQGGGELYQQEGLAFQAVFSIRDIQARWKQITSN